jgi:lipopolysaccharide export system permease protein
MRVLTRYVLAELAKIFLLALSVMTIFMIVVGVVAEASRQGLGPAQIARLLPYILPNALLFTIPGTILFAVSSVYGRMSSSNEIVAIKSAGISPMVVLWPALFFAVLLSLLTVWLNDVAVSWGTEGMQRVVIEAVEEIAYSKLKTQRSYGTKDFLIHVKDVQGRRLVKPTVVFEPKDDKPGFTIMAEWAEMSSDFERQELKIALHDFTVHGDSSFNLVEPGTQEIAIPLAKASRADQRPMMPARMSLRVLPGRQREHEARLDAYRDQLAFHGAVALATGNFADLASDEWTKRNLKLGWDTNDLHRFETEPQRRWANGFSCLAFVLVGAATSIKRRNSDFLTSFFMVFAPTLAIYYPLLMFGLDGAKNGTLPPWSVWSGNVFMGLWGLKQIGWVLRY